MSAPTPCDPTLRSLFFPERDAPLADFGVDWIPSLRNVWLRAGADHAPIDYISALLGRREVP